MKAATVQLKVETKKINLDEVEVKILILLVASGD
jgi:hypothetical protein